MWKSLHYLQKVINTIIIIMISILNIIPILVKLPSTNYTFSFNFNLEED